MMKTILYGINGIVFSIIFYLPGVFPLYGYNMSRIHGMKTGVVSEMLPDNIDVVVVEGEKTERNKPNFEYVEPEHEVRRVVTGFGFLSTASLIIDVIGAGEFIYGFFSTADISNVVLSQHIHDVYLDIVHEIEKWEIHGRLLALQQCFNSMNTLYQEVKSQLNKKENLTFKVTRVDFPGKKFVRVKYGNSIEEYLRATHNSYDHETNAQILNQFDSITQVVQITNFTAQMKGNDYSLWYHYVSSLRSMLLQLVDLYELGLDVIARKGDVVLDSPIDINITEQILEWENSGLSGLQESFSNNIKSKLIDFDNAVFDAQDRVLLDHFHFATDDITVLEGSVSKNNVFLINNEQNGCIDIKEADWGEKHLNFQSHGYIVYLNSCNFGDYQRLRLEFKRTNPGEYLTKLNIKHYNWFVVMRNVGYNCGESSACTRHADFGDFIVYSFIENDGWTLRKWTSNGFSFRWIRNDFDLDLDCTPLITSSGRWYEKYSSCGNCGGRRTILKSYERCYAGPCIWKTPLMSYTQCVIGDCCTYLTCDKGCLPYGMNEMSSNNQVWKIKTI